MHRWVADEWAIHVAHGVLSPQDVDEFLTDLEATDAFEKSPGAWAQHRGRELVKERGGRWQTSRKQNSESGNGEGGST